MGIYSTMQFLGIFVGGAVGGWLNGRYGHGAIYLLGAAMVGLWLMAATTMQRPQFLQSYLLPVGSRSELQAGLLANKLMTVKGVSEAVIVGDTAYLKVDRRSLDETSLQALAKA
jgi:MFS family permease